MNRKHEGSVYKRTRLAVRAIVFLAASLALPVLASLWTEWNEYPANPVFDPANAAYRAYYPTAVYDAAAFSGHGPAAYYRMWFAQGGGIGGAYSNDGIV